MDYFQRRYADFDISSWRPLPVAQMAGGEKTEPVIGANPVGDDEMTRLFWRTAGHGFFHDLRFFSSKLVPAPLVAAYLNGQVAPGEYDVPLVEIVSCASQVPPMFAAMTALVLQEWVAEGAPVAQGRTTQFAHMQVEQLALLARNATHRRKIFRKLMEEEDYWKENSKFRRLKKVLMIERVPIFSKSECIVELPVDVDGGIISVLCSPQDLAGKWFSRVKSVAKQRAQGLFSFSVEHTVHQETLDRLSGFFEECKALMEKFGCAVSVTMKFASLFSKMVAAYLADFKWSVCAALLLDVLISYSVSDNVISTVFKVVSDCWSGCIAYFMPDEGYAVAESSGDVATSAITCVIVAVSACMFGKFPTGLSIAGIIAGVKCLGDVSRGAKNSWTFLYDIVAKVINDLSTWYYGCPADITELSKYCSDVTTWYAEVAAVISLTNNQDLKSDPALCRRIEGIYRRGLEISVGLRHTPIPRDIKDGFNTHFAVVKDLYKKAANSGAHFTGARAEPIVTYLCGDPGVGKSGLVPLVAAAICMFEGVSKDEEGKDDVFREMYFRNPTQEFWDGYYGQRVVIYDDFAQRVDSANNPNIEFDEIIRTGNIARYPLHMAALEDKDTTNFTSKAVVLTSNLHPRNLVIRSLNTPQAVLRRLEHCYQVSIDPEVSTDVTMDGVQRQRLDINKVRAIYNSERTTEFYRFHKINPETMMTEPHFIRFPEYITRLRNSYKDKEKNFVTSKDWILGVCDQIRRCGDGPLVIEGNIAFDPMRPPPRLTRTSL